MIDLIDFVRMNYLIFTDSSDDSRNLIVIISMYLYVSGGCGTHVFFTR